MHVFFSLHCNCYKGAFQEIEKRLKAIIYYLMLAITAAEWSLIMGCLIEFLAELFCEVIVEKLLRGIGKSIGKQFKRKNK